MNKDKEVAKLQICTTFAVLIISILISIIIISAEISVWISVIIGVAAIIVLVCFGKSIQKKLDDIYDGHEPIR